MSSRWQDSHVCLVLRRHRGAEGCEGGSDVNIGNMCILGPARLYVLISDLATGTESCLGKSADSMNLGRAADTLGHSSEASGQIGELDQSRLEEFSANINARGCILGGITINANTIWVTAGWVALGSGGNKGRVLKTCRAGRSWSLCSCGTRV